MKAMRIHQFGDADQFKLEHIQEPQLAPGKILIRVAASSVNPIDVKVRKGLVPGISPELPAVLHGDVAGTVINVSPEITDFKPDDRVFALGGGLKGHDGALAEYMSVDASLLVKLPPTVSFETAAVMPICGLTAWQALVDRGQLKKGQHILIHGGLGGVGHLAIQLAKYLGAEITTTVSSEEKAHLARALGADHVINYKEQSVSDYVKSSTFGRGFDLVLDTIGKDNLDRSLEAAAIHGTIISTSTRSTHDLTPLHQKALTLHVVFVLLPLLTQIDRAPGRHCLSEWARLIEGGFIKPLIDPRTFGFSEIAKAHEYSESGKHIGKILLVNDLL